jgi:photosynthetic reaction center cytochrome c subunit
MGDRYGQNAPAKNVGLASLPVDPYTPFLSAPGQVRVAATDALPKPKTMGATIQHTEWNYGLMMHISQALGVNCTFCHNSRSFQEWERPQRATAWYGIRMVRDLNAHYIDPLKTALPAERLGPSGDAPKANCATCHQGVNKPLQGVAMVAGYPELVGKGAAPATSAAPAASAAAPAPLSGTLAKVLFEVGRRDLSSAALAEIESAARALKDQPGAKVDLSGFADKTGNAAQNLELAKQRAFAVRDALKTAGVAEDRINLRKPEFVIGGVSADARRVEINVVN